MKKTWLWVGLAALVLLSFLLSESLWTSLSRKKAIQKNDKELRSLELDIEMSRQKVTDLGKNSRSYETLVREELNYLRPGEKEVRFLGSDKK